MSAAALLKKAVAFVLGAAPAVRWDDAPQAAVAPPSGMSQHLAAQLLADLIGGAHVTVGADVAQRIVDSADAAHAALRAATRHATGLAADHALLRDVRASLERHHGRPL